MVGDLMRHSNGNVIGTEGEAAFELLNWLSQRENVKVRTLADRLVSKFRDMSAPVLPERSHYDNTLMTLQL